MVALGCAASDDGEDGLGAGSGTGGATAEASVGSPTGDEPGTSGGDPATSGEAGSTSAAASTSEGHGGDSSDEGSGEGSDSTGEEPLGDRVLFAVGYGGIRVRSLDGGHTWQDLVQLGSNGGDDQNLLRGAAWGAGRFVAVGWRIFSSPDAMDWTEHDNPINTWYGGVAHGNDRFVALGGGGLCARSDDGLVWEACTDATPDGFIHVRSVVFHEGEFWIADDQGNTRTSTDGDDWAFESNVGTSRLAVVDGRVTTVPSDHPAQFDDVWLSRAFGGSIMRAEPGSDMFAPVYQVPDGNSVFQAAWLAFGEGFVEPR